MGSRAVEKGYTAEVVATNVRAVRERRRLTQLQLAARMAEVGRPMQASAVAKVESGDRRVDVDDLAAFAVALNVPPARLLLPDVAEDAEVHVVPAYSVSMRAAWGWATGQHALYRDGAYDLGDPDVAARDLEYVAERPVWLRVRAEHPLARAAAQLAWAVDRTLGAVAGAHRGADMSPATGIAVVPWLRSVKRAMDAVRDEALQLQEQAAVTRG